jgi:hypothetical protein
VNKHKYNLIKSKLNSLRDQYTINNPNIISTYIKDTILNNYILKVEGELREFSQNVVDQIEEILERVSQNNMESLIFFQKLKADYLKYILDIIDDDEDKVRVEYECQAMYQSAYELCNHMQPHSPLTLSVILNYSVYLYYINNDTQLALEIAESGYTNAIIKLNDRIIPEINHILKLLQQNIDVWSKELSVKK